MYSDKIALTKDGRIHSIEESENVLNENEFSHVYEMKVRVISVSSFRLIVLETVES